MQVTNRQFLIGTVMAAVSAASAAATAMVSAHDTKKALEHISEAEEKLGRPLSKKEKFKLCWKDYIPTGIMVVITGGLSLGSNVISTKAAQNLQTTGIALLASAGAKIDELKKEKFEKDAEAVRNDPEKVELLRPHYGEVGGTLFWMEEMDGFFRANPIDVLNAISHANQKIARDGVASLGEMLEEFNSDSVFSEDNYAYGWTAEYLEEMASFGAANKNFGFNHLQPRYNLVNLDPDSEVITRDDVSAALDRNNSQLTMPTTEFCDGLPCVVITFDWWDQPEEFDSLIAREEGDDARVEEIQEAWDKR